MQHDEHEEAITNAAWFDRLFPIAMAISIAASTWFLNQAWTKITTLEGKVQNIEVSMATTSGNRFTSGDWVTAKSLLDTERTSMDRRIIRLEESIPVIKDSLIEIKDNLVHVNTTNK